MRAEWDAAKEAVNFRKHGVGFAGAVSVFDDVFAITIPDKSSAEERFMTLGVDAFGRVIVVVYTWRGEAVRIISARKATRRERRQYEEYR